MAISFFSSIDPNTMVLGLLFVAFFAILNFALFKFLKNKGTSAVIAFSMALLSVYGLYKANLDVSEWFYNLGLSENALYTIVPILILAGLGFMIWKLKLPRALTLLGAMLIIISFTPLIYEKGTVLIVGIILFIPGIILWIRSSRKAKMNQNQRR